MDLSQGRRPPRCHTCEEGELELSQGHPPHGTILVVLGRSGGGSHEVDDAIVSAIDVLVGHATRRPVG